MPAHRHREQDRHRDGPALVQRDQEQVGEQHRQRDQHAGLPRRRLLLQGRAGPGEAVARGQGAGGDLLHGPQRIARGDAGLRRAVHGQAADVVVALQRLRPDHHAHIGEGAQRHHLAAAVAHADAPDVGDVVAVGRLGLDVHLPDPAEQVEVVHVEAAQRRLQRGEDVADAHAQRLRLVAVDVQEQRGRGRREGGEDAVRAAGPVRLARSGRAWPSPSRPGRGPGSPAAGTRSRRRCRGR